MVNAKVVKLVEHIVKHTWKNASTAADALRQNTDRQVRIVATVLKRETTIMKECIMDSVEGLVRTFVVEATTKLIRPLIMTASVPIAKAYAAVVKQLYAYVTEKFITTDGDEEDLTASVSGAAAAAGEGGGSAPPASTEFSRFVNQAHIAIDCDWMPMILIRGTSRSIVGVAANSDMTPPTRGSMSASAASLLPHSSSSLGNFNAMHTNHLLFESKLILDELRQYNGSFQKVSHVFNAGFTSKDAINLIVEHVRVAKLLLLFLIFTTYVF